MKPAIRTVFLPILLIGALASAVWAEDYSHVRIVRLSFTQGTVSLERLGSTQWSKAPVNTPIEEGFKLSSDPGSFAEVEFENGSTARIGEQSLLDFNQLAIETASGDKINRMTLQQGYGTFHVERGKGDVFEVRAGDARIEAAPKAEFRVDLEGQRVRVEVFKGSVQVSSHEGSTTLSKNNVLEINHGAELAFLTTHGIKKDDWDAWVRERDEVEAGNRAPSIFRNAPGYGWSDLNDYGEWGYFPGYGYGWTPSLIGGWSPFSYGQWCWYPGLGYTWISSAPWGWLPFHYGSWGFDPVAGWIWFPGAFNNWSPGTVTWYQGAGWVGWVPRGMPAPPPKSYTKGNAIVSPCQAGGACKITTVTAEAFQSGKPVTPLAVKEMTVAGAQPLSKVALAPGQSAFLSGPSVTPSFMSTRGAGRGAAPGITFERGARVDHSAPVANATFGPRGFPASRNDATFGRATAWSHRSAPAASPRSASMGRSMRSGGFEGRAGGWSGASRSEGGFSAPSHSISAPSPSVSNSMGSGGGGHASGGGRR